MVVSRSIFCLICVVLISSLSRGQNQEKADSVRSILDSSELDSEQELYAYYLLGQYSSSPEEILRSGNELLTRAMKIDNTEYQLKAYTAIGVAHRLKGDLGTALEYQFKAANEAIGNAEFIYLLVQIYAEISTCYTLNGDSESALLYGSKTIGILRQTDRKKELALSLLNTGYDYYLINQYDSAMAYYNESEPILKEIGLDIGLAYIIGNRALVYWKQGDTKTAKIDLFKAIGMLEPIGDRYGIADYYNQLGTIYLEENATDEAILYTMKSLEIAKEEGLKEQVRDASNLLFQLHQEKGDFQHALDYLVQFYAYRDSIQNLETTQQLANLRTEFEVGQKQAEVDLLVEQKRSNQIVIITGGIILIVVICLVIVSYAYSKSKNILNKQLEEQRNSLLKLNQTKDKFFSIISHDLRGPVNSLSGLINVSRYFVDDAKDKKLIDAIDKMEISVDRLVKLLDSLLTWALQQRGHFPHFPENVNLNQMLVDVIEMSRDMATSKRITFDYQAEEDIYLYVDKNTTSTVLRNLVNNALKFTPEGGHVKILSKTDFKQKVGIIQVVDNGVGIPKEKLDNLFKLNEKISTRGTSGETGLGLGLQLVLEFVEINNGKVAVTSEPNEGTTFTISLPLSQESHREEITTSSAVVS